MLDTTGRFSKEMLLTRTIYAPRLQVFQAWTNPKLLAKWWGPENFTNPVCMLNLVPGGGMYIEMSAPDGRAYTINGRYLDIIVPELLVFSSGTFEDKEGNDQLEIQHTAIFEEEGDHTKLTLHAVVMRASSEMQGPVQQLGTNWLQSLERLNKVVSRLNSTT